MIVSTAPNLKLISSEQIKYINSLDIDPRSSIQEKVETFGYRYTPYEDKDPNSAGGFCSFDRREIAINTTTAKKYFPRIIAHELSHVIQGVTCDFKYKTVSDAIVYEQQAESITKFLLLPKLFPGHRMFYNSYFDNNDWQWLAKYFDYWFDNDLSEVKTFYNKSIF